MDLYLLVLQEGHIIQAENVCKRLLLGRLQAEQALTKQGEGMPGFLKVISIVHAIDRRVTSLRSVEKVFGTC